MTPKRFLLFMSVAVFVCCRSAASEPQTRELNRPKYAGTFAHFTRTGGELREISLPSGRVLQRMKFPVNGLSAGSVPSGGISRCKGKLVTALSKKYDEYGLYLIDLEKKSVEFLREGLWPTCGPNGELFFYSSLPGRLAMGLYVARFPDLDRATLLIEGEYSSPQPLVFAGNRFMATYDPKQEKQVLFELKPEATQRVWQDSNCEPLFWRSRLNELVCLDSEGVMRSQSLRVAPKKALIDTEKMDLGGVLHYWPDEDALLTIHIRGGWAATEYQDLVAVDLATKKKTTLVRDTNVNAFGFTALSK